MTEDQWGILKAMVAGKKVGLTKALIIDSPWIPSHMGIPTDTFIKDEQVHLESWFKIVRDYPQIIFFPDFWVERGMAAEPSGFGCPITYYTNQPPTVSHVATTIEEAVRLKVPAPHTDGLMPDILAQYRRILPKVRAQDMDIRIIAARGPLTLASHVMGVTSFLLALKNEPEKTHELLRITTETVKRWLIAQMEILPGCQGYFLMDDILGFLSQEDYLQFAHPYLKEIFSLPGTLKCLHNDTPNPVAFCHLPSLGVNLLNFSHQLSLSKVRQMVGSNMILMGNIPPMEVLVRGTVQEVMTAARYCIEENGNENNFLLSAGGGTSIGTPASSIEALSQVEA